MNNLINHPMIKQIFCTLKWLFEFFTHSLFNHAFACKTNHGFWLSKVNIT